MANGIEMESLEQRIARKQAEALEQAKAQAEQEHAREQAEEARRAKQKAEYEGREEAKRAARATIRANIIEAAQCAGADVVDDGTYYISIDGERIGLDIEVSAVTVGSYGEKARFPNGAKHGFNYTKIAASLIGRAKSRKAAQAQQAKAASENEKNIAYAAALNAAHPNSIMRVNPEARWEKGTGRQICWISYTLSNLTPEQAEKLMAFAAQIAPKEVK